MRDKIEIIGKGTVIQHGKHNDRIYLMKLSEADVGDRIFSEISKMAHHNRYSKIICKIPKQIAPLFLAEGYMLEAYIPLFYNNIEDAFFVSKFLNSDRLLDIEQDQLKGLSQLLSDKPKQKNNLKKEPPAYTIRRLNQSDVYQITTIYRDIFETYPFPIHNPEYILKTMDDDVQYYGAELNGNLVALSSAEIEFNSSNAEMTDFATLTNHTGKNLSSSLLQTMEIEMRNQGIKTLYTIARLNSIAMNKTFMRAGYQYSGTLIKNTNIAGDIESMNVYYKHI